MIEYSIGICYGMILTDETLRAINECFPDDDTMDEFSETYLRSINAWTGEEWFLGLYYELANSVFDIDGLRWDKADLEELKLKLHNYGITNIIDWLPKKYIIQFCY